MLAAAHPPPWHHDLAWAALALGVVCALAILAHEILRGDLRERGVMAVVDPVTALYLGPAWLWFYASGSDVKDVEEPTTRQVTNAVSHCGAGCTLGDIVGEWLVFALGIAWFGRWSGHQLPEELLLDFLFAWALGIGFQYLTIFSLRRAVAADSASIVAFQIGLFGWMAFFMLVLWPHHGITVDSPDFWFEMQIGMILGFLTAWPVNRLLLARGIKEPM